MGTYQSVIDFGRTPEEKHDVFLAWQRPDKAFFASGACHILAHLFVWMHRHEGFEFIHIKPRDDVPGHHAYASDGRWAFDFNGWTLEEELLREHENAHKQKYPGWAHERVVVPNGWKSYREYILENNHRPPEFFPELPWKRAYDYINQFPAKPPLEEG